MRSKPASVFHPTGLIRVIGLMLLLGGVAEAKDQLWGALLMGTNHTAPSSLPAELGPYQKQLSKVFGYSNFKVLSQSTRDFTAGNEQWLIPGKTFSIRSVVQHTADANFKVALQLFQANKELVQTEAKLGPDSPLFIRGPLYGNGQLIIVIMVRNDH